MFCFGPPVDIVGLTYLAAVGFMILLVLSITTPANSSFTMCGNASGWFPSVPGSQ